MADANGQSESDLTLRLADLQKQPWSYNFFMAMRLVECNHASLPRLGKSRRLDDDPIRLLQDVAMSFESATLTRFEPSTVEKPARLAQRFFGLLGPQGPMPLHFTEFVLERLKHHRDPTFARFLNLFNQRMLSLFYRAWANNEPTISYDRPEDDRFADYVASLEGLGLDSLKNRDTVPDRIKYHFCGHFAGANKNREGLQAIISVFFNIPCTIAEFSGRWQNIPNRDRFQLGADPATGALGTSAILGEMFWSVDQTLQIRLGPLNYADYYSFLPGRKRLKQLADLICNYIGSEFAWDVVPILKQTEIPEFRIKAETRLGWTCCLGTRFWQGDVDNLKIRLIS